MAVNWDNIKLPEKLNVFRNANKEWLTEESYNEILKRFIKIWDLHIYRENMYLDIEWSETENGLELFHDKEEPGGFHDEMYYDSIKIVFERKFDLNEEPEWKESSDWPCEGEVLVKNEFINTEHIVGWNAHEEKSWLLKKPYGLPGIWVFEYKNSSERY